MLMHCKPYNSHLIIYGCSLSGAVLMRSKP